MELNKIGLLLINSIHKNNTENKNNFFKSTKNFKDRQEMAHNKYLEDISYYISHYEKKRNENKNLYDEYLAKRFILYKNWKDSKQINDLNKLLKLDMPKFEEVPDIYTKKRPKSLLK
jgi:hypothetical protein